MFYMQKQRRRRETLQAQKIDYQRYLDLQMEGHMQQSPTDQVMPADMQQRRK